MSSDGKRFRFFYKGKAYLIPKDYIDDEHPGGGDEIWPWVNKDMTEAFDDADHSLDALEMLEEYLDVDYDSNEVAEEASDKKGEKEETEEEAREARETSVKEAVAAAEAAPAATASASAVKENPAAPAGLSVATPPGKAEVKKSAVSVTISAAAVVVVIASATVVLSKLIRRR